jgi:hypothetical protein
MLQCSCIRRQAPESGASILVSLLEGGVGCLHELGGPDGAITHVGAAFTFPQRAGQQLAGIKEVAKGLNLPLWRVLAFYSAGNMVRGASECCPCVRSRRQASAVPYAPVRLVCRFCKQILTCSIRQWSWRSVRIS